MADRFLGPRAGERPIHAPEGHADADIRVKEWHERMIAETRRVWGTAAARAQWIQFGYPDHSHLMAVVSEPAQDEDACPPENAVEALRDFLIERDAHLIPATEAGSPTTWGWRG